MKLTINNLLNIKDAIEKLASYSLKLEVEVSYSLLETLEKVEVKLKPFRKLRAELVKKYGSIQKDKKTYRVSERKEEAFKKDIQALLRKEVDLDLEQISVKKLRGVELPTVEVLKIKPILKG